MKPPRALVAEPPRELDRVAALDRHRLASSLREPDDTSFEDVDRREDVEVCANTLSCYHVIARYHAIMTTWPRRAHPSPDGAGAARPRSRVSTSSPPRSARCGPTDEVTRFLRDLCTRAELEALAHRWQTARLLDEGVPYLEIAERVPTSTATVTRVAQWVQARHRRLPDRARADEAAMSAFTRAGENGRLTARRPGQGPHGRADAAAAAPMPGSRSRRPSARSSCRARTRRSTSCSSGRATSPSTSRTASSTSASRARTSSSRRRPTSLTLAELGFARCTLQAAVPNDAPQTGIADLGGLRVATAYPISTQLLLGRARHRRRARARLRLRRGDAAPRSRRRDRRSRLDRLDRERQRAAADRDAALLAGRPDRRPRARSRSSTTSSSASS